MTPTIIIRTTLYTAVLAGISSTQVWAQQASPTTVQGPPITQFDIPSQAMATALQRFAEQSGMQLLYRADAVGGRTAPALHGAYDRRDGLRRLLAGSDLEVIYSGGYVATIRPRGESAAGQGQTEVSAPAGPAAQQVDPDVEGVSARTDTARRDPVSMDAVTVTGTRIRGGESPSPVITIGIESIREEGFSDLGEVIRSIPQNFGGGQNPGVAGGATAGAGGLANQNVTGGSGLNLRGLGPDASLTLLNGRRMAYGGFVQAVDISAIPVEAVERIEILPDGASAIYGSDAVGGVGNVILQRDYDGVAIGARYGGATEGGLTTRENTVTAGAAWSNGGLIAAYKKLSVDAVYARQRDYTEYMAEPSTLYPESDLRSGVISAHQALGGSVEVRIDAMRTERDQVFYPYNTSLLSYYNVMTPESSSTLVSPGVDISLPNDWTLQFGLGWGEDKLLNRQTHIAHGSGTETPRANECLCNEIRTYELGAEGPVFATRAGDARIAVGVGQRNVEYEQINYLARTTAIQGAEKIRFGYAEISLPIIGPKNSMPGARRFELNLAARGEDYDSFGGVVTPKAGVIYGPSEDLTLKASWGRAFKAPTLFQRYWARQVLLRPAAELGGANYPDDATVLLVGGGNPDLEAERARTWSASVVFHPQALPGMELELSWFDVDYTDRVIQPLANFSQTLGNPLYERFIDYSPTIEDQEGVLASADQFFNLTGRPYDPGTVVAIPYSRYANVARQRIKGVDLSASYRLDVGSGRLTIRGSGSWLDSSQQATPEDDAYDLAGTLFSPARFSGRVGAVWAQGGFSASGFVSHTSGVTNALVAGVREKTGSFTTVDAVLRFELGERSQSRPGFEVALTAQNLLNRAPPLYAPLAAANPPYDSTNYSAIGRFVALSAAVRF